MSLDDLEDFFDDSRSQLYQKSKTAVSIFSQSYVLI